MLVEARLEAANPAEMRRSETPVGEPAREPTEEDAGAWFRHYGVAGQDDECGVTRADGFGDA
jgi:hypothetical protein